jgi:hypothetical protein
MHETVLFLLTYAVYPAWVGAGLADWACHRRTCIETSSGLAENAFHWVLYAIGGAGVVAAVVLQTTGGALAIVAACWLLHELLVWFELRYTVPRRPVRPAEQMVHSFLELLPLAGMALLALLSGDRLGDWTLALRPPPWPWTALAAGLLATVLLNLLPLAHEGWRCWQARLMPRTPPPPEPR